MSKLDDYWKNISLQAKAKGINKSVDDVERIWRNIASDLDKEGINPDNMRYKQMLINRTREKVMKESKFELFLEIENTNTKLYKITYKQEWEEEEDVVNGLTWKEVIKEYKRHYPHHEIKTPDDLEHYENMDYRIEKDN